MVYLKLRVFIKHYLNKIFLKRISRGTLTPSRARAFVHTSTHLRWYIKRPLDANRNDAQFIYYRFSATYEYGSRNGWPFDHWESNKLHINLKIARIILGH